MWAREKGQVPDSALPLHNRVNNKQTTFFLFLLRGIGDNTLVSANKP